MKKLKNNLYITSQDSYLHKQGETVAVRRGDQKPILVPAHSLHGIYCFGQVMVSPQLMGFCAEQGIRLAFFTEYGRFLGRVEGRQQGSILLRRAQYRYADTKAVDIARVIIAAKIKNCRTVLLRRLRTYGDCAPVSKATHALEESLRQLRTASTLDHVRGIEGEAASRYFHVFSALILPARQQAFPFYGRNRRPPRDAVNAMLSFVYSVLGQDISAALQGVGLDPQAGFLHADRPGRDSLAQDMLEEFRAWFADRLILTLINRQQIQTSDFIFEASGAVRMTDEGRKKILTALQCRKQEEVTHPLLNESIQIGLLPHIQSLLLARHVRGEISAYPPFTGR